MRAITATKKNFVRIIKKYQNRRLYDVTTSTYVVFDDIKQIIIGGEEIRVVDVKTEQDVTRSVLLQILLEEEMHGMPVLSNEFLYQIIRFYGKGFNTSLGPFLEQGLDLFRKMQKQFYEQIRDIYGKEKLSSGVELWKEFIKNHGPEIEDIIKEQMQNNTNAFLRMQEQLHKQTRQLFDYMQLPFNSPKSE